MHAKKQKRTQPSKKNARNRVRPTHIGNLPPNMTYEVIQRLSPRSAYQLGFVSKQFKNDAFARAKPTMNARAKLARAVRGMAQKLASAFVNMIARHRRASFAPHHITRPIGGGLTVSLEMLPLQPELGFEILAGNRSLYEDVLLVTPANTDVYKLHSTHSIVLPNNAKVTPTWVAKSIVRAALQMYNDDPLPVWPLAHQLF